jgi:hypothetical protein
MFGRDLIEQAAADRVDVPVIVTKSISAVEAVGQLECLDSDEGLRADQTRYGVRRDLSENRRVFPIEADPAAL